MIGAKRLGQAFRRFVNEGPKIEIPNVGKSSGMEDLDDATKKWRQTNTLEDEKFKKYIKTLEESQETPEVKPKPIIPNKNPITGEIDGPKGPEPTRYKDWERNGRCFDF